VRRSGPKQVDAVAERVTLVDPKGTEWAVELVDSDMGYALRVSSLDGTPVFGGRAEHYPFKSVLLVVRERS
jgi:hypothetical protein